jgi:DNA-binding transcriptional MocR family regulator
VLARELSTHRNTVARAYSELEEAGFVCGSVGRGTFVEATEPPVARSGKAAADSSSTGVPWETLVARAARPEVVARAERWARPVAGRDVINMARMQPSADLMPDESIRRCIARVFSEHGAKALGYGPADGEPRLREQIAGELVSRGVPATPEDVLVTSGSQQGLDLIARALVNPGDTILVESTTYSGAIDLFTIAGARLVSVPCDDDGPDPTALERLARPDVKALYVMPTGHNPTGRTISAERRRALVAWSQRSAIPLIEDDFVAGLRLEDDEGTVAPHLRTLDGEVIHLSTFSKRLIPSLRIGYLLAPPALRPTIRSLKRIVDLGSSSVTQLALAEFIERGYLKAHTTRVRREYRVRRDALASALTKALPEEVTWRIPTDGIVMWLGLPSFLDPAAVQEAAQREGVIVSPSPMWSADPNVTPAVRLSFCAEPEARLVEGARRLGKAIKSLLAKGTRHRDVPRELEAV